MLAMYMCQTISVGFVFSSLPVILRHQSISLKGIGAIFILHLPWALKFLWSPWVDNYYISGVGRRRSWIFPLQWAGAVVLAILSLTPPAGHFTTIYLLLFILNMIMATNDIAVDGYATDILLAHERPWGNTIQAGARFAGMMLGGGLMLFLHASLGWTSLCLILSGAVLVLSLPVVFHVEMPSNAGNFKTERIRGAGVLEFLKQPEVRRVLAILILPTTFVFTGFQMRMPLFADLGLSARHLGSILMNWAYPAGLAGTVFFGWFLGKAGEKTFLRLFCVIALVVSGYTILCALRQGIGYWQAAVVLCLDNILIGGVHTWAYTRMMHVSAGPRAGTGFAVLSSLFILFPLASAPAFGAAGDWLGFAVLYFILEICMLGGFLAAEWLQGPAKRVSGKVTGTI